MYFRTNPSSSKKYIKEIGATGAVIAILLAIFAAIALHPGGLSKTSTTSQSCSSPGSLCADYHISFATLNITTLSLTINNTGYVDLTITSATIGNEILPITQNPQIPANTTENLSFDLPPAFGIVSHTMYSVVIVATATSAQGNATLPRQVTVLAE